MIGMGADLGKTTRKALKDNTRLCIFLMVLEAAYHAIHNYVYLDVSK